MIVYDLKQFGLKLKMELQSDSSAETAKRIAFEIETAMHPNGTPLTSEEKGISLSILNIRHMTIKQAASLFIMRIIQSF